MIHRTDVVLRPDGVYLPRYGVLWTFEEAEKIQQNIACCLLAREAQQQASEPENKTEQASRPAGPTPAQTGSGI